MSNQDLKPGGADTASCAGERSVGKSDAGAAKRERARSASPA